jgi:hypothetical protein
MAIKVKAVERKLKFTKNVSAGIVFLNILWFCSHLFVPLQAQWKR